MFRTGLRAVDVLVGNRKVQGGLLGKILNGPSTKVGTKNKIWTRTIATVRTAEISSTSTRATSELWASSSSRTILRATRQRAAPSLRTTAPPRRPFQTSRARRREKEPGNNGSGAGNTGASLSLSQRLKKLSKEYGWTAVGVYLTLSVLDFPFCFLLVRIVGTEKIAALEEVVVSNVQKVIPERAKQFWNNYQHSLKENTAKQQEATAAGGEAVIEDVEMAGWGVKEAEERRAKEGASLATQLALAYAIHKSFIFIRVPLTAAILPKVVKVLRSWGWNIGSKVSKAKSFKR